MGFGFIACCRARGLRAMSSMPSIARIERRRLRWSWRTDPTLEGATISLRPHDLERVREWRRYVARVDNLGALTARRRDRLL
jgi:hypothetical protein